MLPSFGLLSDCNVAPQILNCPLLTGHIHFGGIGFDALGFVLGTPGAALSTSGFGRCCGGSHPVDG